MSRSPFDALVDFRCAICNARMADGPCGCLERCRCGRTAVTKLGEQRADSLHTSAGCSTPGCPNEAPQRGCRAVWWRNSDEGRLCVLAVGHKGRHRYSLPHERKVRR